MDFTKYNKSNYKIIDWEIDTKDFQFTKLSNFSDGEKINVNGFFFLKDNFNDGLQLIMIARNSLINCPKHKVETVKEMLQDDDTIQAIKKGECNIIVKHYTGKKGASKGKDCVTFDFI